MTDSKHSEIHTYKIGAVSRLTGISPDTLRIWERRYDIVTPQRTPAGGRLYSQEDISRLSLIKSLVDAGDSISTVAGFSLQDLQNRLATSNQSKAAKPVGRSEQPCRLVILGEGLSLSMRDTRDQLDDVDVVGSFADFTSFENAVTSLKPDVLLIEIPTLHEDSASGVIDWLQKSGALHAIIVYRYGNAESLRRIPVSRCSIVRAPVEPLTIQRHCQFIFGMLNRAEMDTTEAIPAFSQISTPRRYDDETLARVARQSTAIKCECPRHLSELISSLAAFEQYSAECESRSPEDAALHAFLNSTASRARVMIENALSRVIESENIEI